MALPRAEAALCRASPQGVENGHASRPERTHLTSLLSLTSRSAIPIDFYNFSRGWWRQRTDGLSDLLTDLCIELALYCEILCNCARNYTARSGIVRQEGKVDLSLSLRRSVFTGTLRRCGKEDCKSPHAGSIPARASILLSVFTPDCSLFHSEQSFAFATTFTLILALKPGKVAFPLRACP